MSRHPGPSTPQYSESQATAWLAWLARSLQDQGQTVFLIEKLQPSWLLLRRDRWTYILVSRLLWGIAMGLSVGLLGGLSRELISLYQPTNTARSGLEEGVLYGLFFGLSLGLCLGLSDLVLFSHPRVESALDGSSTRRRTITMLSFGLFFGVLGGLLFGLLSGLYFRVPLMGLAVGLIGGLGIAVLVEPFWLLRGLKRNLHNDIHTIETIRFSWRHFSKGLMQSLLVGLSVGLVVGLSSTLINGQGREVFMKITLIIGLGTLLIIRLMACIQPGVRELKTTPNQGIRLSFYTAVVMGGLGGLGLMVIFCGLLVTFGLFGEWWIALTFGALGGLCFALWYGGLDVAQHGLVRFMLYRQGATPWNYAHFLDYAAEDIHFLQKVGGSYIFVHRYLLEHFAAMGEINTSPNVR